MPPEDKKKLVEYNKEWFNRQSSERREIKQKARIYHKNRYNLMVRIKNKIVVVVGYEGIYPTPNHT